MKVNMLHLLTIIFVFAKLFEVINWSWWLVFLPSIVSIGIGLLVFLMIAIMAWYGNKNDQGSKLY